MANMHEARGFNKIKAPHGALIETNTKNSYQKEQCPFSIYSLSRFFFGIYLFKWCFIAYLVFLDALWATAP